MNKPKKLPAIDAIAFGIQAWINQIRTIFFTMLTIIAIGIAVGGPGLFIFRWFTQIPITYGMLNQVSNYERLVGFLKSFQSSNLFIIFVIILVTFTFIGWAVTGITRIVLEITDVGYSSARQMFTDFHQIPKVLCAFVIWVFVLLAGLLCFLIPGVIWLIRTQFYLYFIVDKNVGIFESFSKSIATTRGYGWQLLGFNIFMYMLQSVTFQLSGMISGISIAYLYRKLTSEPREI